jgi:hypothetical protein
MKIKDLLEKKIPNPTPTQCSRPNLSNVRNAQCVSLGYKAHNTAHTAGTGKQGKKGSGVPLMGKKLRSERHGGPVKDYAGPTRGGKSRKKS